MSSLPPSAQLFSVPPSRWVLLGAMLSLGVLSGCSATSSGERRLPDSTFTQLLTEIHLAKARTPQDASSSPGLRDSIFARYGVADSDFQATLQYYSRRPKAFESLYQSVIDTLQALQHPKRDRMAPEGIPDSLPQKRRQKSAQ